MNLRRALGAGAAGLLLAMGAGAWSPSTADDFDDWPVVCDHSFGSNNGLIVRCTAQDGTSVIVRDETVSAVLGSVLGIITPPPLPDVTAPADCEDAAVDDGRATCTVDGTYVTVDQ